MHDHCILYEDCDLHDDHCDTCATGPKLCSHGYHGMGTSIYYYVNILSYLVIWSESYNSAFFQLTTTLYSPRPFWMSLLTLLYAQPTITTLGPRSAVATGPPIVPTVSATQMALQMWEHPGATVYANMSMVNASNVVKPPPPPRR